MGAVNYGTSKYITLGFDLSKYYEENQEDWDIMEEIKSTECEDSFQYVCELNDCIQLENFKISVELGYYEGFYLKIEPYYLEKGEEEYLPYAIAECLLIGNNLMKFANEGLVSCYPGWCTAYLTIEKTKENIEDAISNMISDISIFN